jgi:glutathione synthase/RimK-type ligase-like ATP-grasp enzyme
MPKRILVAGSPHEVQTAHQIAKLKEHGAEVRIIPADLPPSEVEFSWDDERVVIGGDEIGSIDAALIRSLPPTYLDSTAFRQPLDWQSYFYQFCLQRDRSDTIMGYLLSLEHTGRPCWNSPSRAMLVRRKPYQLDVIRRLGCPVPETLITNDPRHAHDFLNRFQDAIVKPVAGGALTLDAGELSIKELERIRVAPAIFQQRVRGDDIRVVVIGNQIVSSACIRVPPDTIDFRGNQDYAQGKIAYDEVSLPAEIEQDCVRICAALGYRYGGLDLKRVDKNWFVFLECNNSPIYLDVERKLGHPITDVLTEEILASVRTRIYETSLIF